jgi:hypothetical protein
VFQISQTVWCVHEAGEIQIDPAVAIAGRVFGERIPVIGIIAVAVRVSPFRRTTWLPSPQ